ncbi:MAG: hypothetical protein IJ283_03965 [Oscillospiraceae bacterium]|nr:hypothetical protein [Oscillospiraceae bacterium]
MAEMVGFPLRGLLPPSQKYFAALIFLGRQVLTRWVLIHTIKQKRLPKRSLFCLAEMVGFPLRGLLPPSQKYFAKFIFLGRRVLTRWVLIHTIKQKRLPKRSLFLFGGDGGISAARIASAKPKIFRKAHIFGASGTHPVGSHPHHKTKKTPKTEPFLFGGDGGIRTHVPG